MGVVVTLCLVTSNPRMLHFNSRIVLHVFIPAASGSGC